jgi:hypothetical protein
MATIWKSTNRKSGNSETDSTTNETFSRTRLSSWSRQQKLATVAGFAILGLLLVVSACSKQSSRPALVGVSSPAAIAAPAVAAASTIAETGLTPPAPTKKTHKQRPANVTYKDASSGVSFLYPRKFELTAGDKAELQSAGLGDVPMNFVQSGGARVATITMPGGSYPGTDFLSAFFNVNVNHNISGAECEHFAVVDTSNSDGEPVDAEKVKVGSTDMEMTSSFSATAAHQDETQYYHRYENGTCYEYVLGLGTEGFATASGIEHVNGDEVFSKLKKILATVKVNPGDQGRVAEHSGSGLATGKE